MQTNSEKTHSEWREVRADLMADYGMNRDRFTAAEIFALRALAIELHNAAAQAQANKAKKSLVR